jgi:putative inorganic carbon (HCO3(-)) transporter
MSPSTLKPARPAWAHFDLAVTLLLAPWFVFPDPAVTPWLLLAFPALWLLRRVVQGRATVVTPIDPPALLIVVMVGVGVWATYDVTLSFPKVAGVLYGVALAYALANDLQGARGVWIVTAGLALLGAGVIALGFVGTSWSGAAKIPILRPWVVALQDRFPRRLTGLPRAESGFNTNQVSGTLALLLPFYVSLTVGLIRSAVAQASHRRWARTLRRAVEAALLGGLALAAALLLLLSQSRGAITATALCLGLWTASQGRAGRWIAGMGGLVVLVLVLLVGPQRVAWALWGMEVANADLSLQGRLVIWHRAWRVLRDHALTGIGFDTLVPIIHARYPTFYFNADADFTHAHNQFLQVGLDLGVPGLIAYLAMLFGYGRALLGVGQPSRGAPSDDRSAGNAASRLWQRGLAHGLLFGVIGQMLFGLTDAIALGQKPGLLFWLAIGLGLSLIRLGAPSTST